MGWRLQRTSRLPVREPATFLIVAVCLVIAGASLALVRGGHGPVFIDLFRTVTGVPCPLCRGTRAAVALSRGDWIDAIAWNPLAVALVVLALAWLVLRSGFGYRLEISLSPRRRVLAGGGLLLAVAANWIYVILMGG